MKFTALAAAALLPFASVMADTTTTLTSTLSVTTTIFLHRVATETAYSNSTTSVYLPTGTGAGPLGGAPTSPAKTTGVAPITPSAGNSLQVAHAALAGVVGMVIVSLL